MSTGAATVWKLTFQKRSTSLCSSVGKPLSAGNPVTAALPRGA